MEILREYYLNKIRPYYDIDLIKVLTGVRRSGKSILLSQIRDEFIAKGINKDHIIEINFEDLSFENIKTYKKLNTYILKNIKDEQKYYIFLDEIQHVNGFEKVLSSLRATQNCSIFITGSNSKLLSGKLATLLVGRCIEFRILPFSFKEAFDYLTMLGKNPNPEFIKGHGHKDSLFMNTIFAKAVCEYGKFVASSDLPSIIHCQDASTAIIPAFVNQNPIYSATKSVVTIHNAGPAYHHNFSSIGEAAWYTNLPTDLLSGSLNNYKVEPFLIAASCGAYLTTVSTEYANELKNPIYSEQTEGLSQIFYILIHYHLKTVKSKRK